MAEIFYTHEELHRGAKAREPRFLRTLAASLAAHAILVAAFVYVPALRDTILVASDLSGIRFVDEDYQKTHVGERAVIINLAQDKLYYPAGYFEMFSQTAVPAPDEPQLVAEVRPTPTPRPRIVRPEPTPTPEDSPAAESAEDEEAADNTGDKATDPNAAAPEPQSKEEAERIAQQNNVEKFPTVNAKPFKDLLHEGLKMKEAGELNLSGTLEMAVEAERQEDGRLANVEVTGGSASDPKLKKLALDFIAALSDSKVLAALKGTRHLRMKVRLDGQEVAVKITTEVASDEDATRMARGYQGLLFLGALSKKGREEEAIFKRVEVSSSAKEIVLTFNMPRKEAGELLSKFAKKPDAAPAS